MSTNHIRTGLEAANTSLRTDGHVIVPEHSGRAVLAFMRALPHLQDGSNLWRLSEMEQWIERELREMVTVVEPVGGEQAVSDGSNVIKLVPR